ncbi:MAG TPA: DNA mismatch repair endonuclease MutL [Spirochaetia bacterium]|nr:DNA mismatch repair endonuclease MutL [Spirochaetia bacterium]
MTEIDSSRRIRLLRDDVARKIAAGEVIDRPHAVVRELLDNALDAGAQNIQVHLESGGIKRIRMVDDGFGMDQEDLDLCWLPHATSKIETEDDLLSASTLGFRGEALASIATVSRLEIVSSQGPPAEASRLVVHGGQKLALEPWRGGRGTTVDVAELFYSLPARRKFLKSASAESAMCRLVLTDRALAFPKVEFRYFTDGNLKFFLPPTLEPGSDVGQRAFGNSVRQRLIHALPEVVHADFLHAIGGSGDGFSCSIVLETPDTFRNDRKYVQTFVNGRRIWEYSFVQAIEYAFEGYLPGGRYPVAFLFLTVDPRNVDFNIHPAKREARFRNLPEIHHRIVEIVRSFLLASARRSLTVGLPDRPQTLPDLAITRDRTPGSIPPAPAIRAEFPRASGAAELRERPDVVFDMNRKFSPGSPSRIRYLGQSMGLFLVAEVDSRLLMVDQHAAHERMLFDRFRMRAGVQNLLVPYAVEVEAEQSAQLRNRTDDLRSEGILIEPLSDVDIAEKLSTWQITAVPSSLSGALDTLAGGLTEISLGSGELTHDLYARMACRSALMDGDQVDPVTAVMLIENSLSLENPRCPHGRPIWHELSREALFALVGRTV